MDRRTGKTGKREGISRIAAISACAGILFFIFAPAILAVPDIPADKITHEDIIAYDPAEGVFVYNAMERNLDKTGFDFSRFKKKTLRRSRTAEREIVEFQMNEKDAASLISALHKNADTGMMKDAGINTRKLKDNIYRVELNNKQDGMWYRMKAAIPRGSRVLKIVRDDGVEITNGLFPGNGPGEYIDKTLWYQQGDNLYFYDDPISGYSIVIAPPQPNFSIMVEVPSQAANNSSPAGQQSALIYPLYASDTDLLTDNVTTSVFYRDHMGEDIDNGIGRDVPGAGARIALRYTNGVNTNQYGNDCTNAACRTNNGNANDRLTAIGAPVYTYLNITPWGDPESVISENFQGNGAGNGRLLFNFTKKTIIRANNKWYGTIYYINNGSATTANNVIFFQGSDMDFNGDPNGDNTSYDNVNDTVFGYKAVPVPAENPNVSYAGFSALAPSSAHEVNLYSTMWTQIRAGALANAAIYNGDASFALQYNLGAMTANSQNVVEMVWGFGNTLNGQAQADMQNGINTGKLHMRDTGIINIKAPYEGQVFQNADGHVMITATAVNYGMRDWNAVPIHISITGPAGFTPVNAVYSYVTFTVPAIESADAGYNFNISAVPAGAYTISVSTNLGADMGVADQNPSNDSRTVHIYVGGLSVEPEIQQTVNIGSVGNINMTVSNTSGANDRYNISIAGISMSWPTYLINGADGVTIASDTNGDGLWEYVNPAYNSDSDANPDIAVNNNTGYFLILRQYVPDTANGGEINNVKLQFTGITNPLVTHTAAESTLATSNPAATKWLWLHNIIQPSTEFAFGLSTITDTAAAGSNFRINRFLSQGWSLSPELYRPLTITNNIPVRLVITDQLAVQARLELFYTDGFSNTVKIGESIVALPLQAAPLPVTFTVNVTSPVTIPAGDRLAMTLYNFGDTVSYIQVYANSSLAQNSDIQLPVNTYVAVDWINSYLNGTNTNTVYTTGNSVRFTGQVSDMFGSYDVAGATITITDPSSTVRVAAAAMGLEATDTSNPSGWKRFIYNYVIPNTGITSGIWTVKITGGETNGVTNSRIYHFTISQPDHIVLSPVTAASQAGNGIMLSGQVTDFSGNPIAFGQWLTVTANNNAVISSVSPGWTIQGPLNKTAYGPSNANGYVTFTVNDAFAEAVTITPASLLPGTPARDQKAYLFFNGANHAEARAADGVAVAGAAGTGEPVRIWIEDINGNTMPSAQWVTVTATGNGYFTSAPALWTIAGNIAYGPSSAGGFADLVVKDNSIETILIAPNSGPWGNHALDKNAVVNFVAPGADHVVLVDPSGGTLTAGAQKLLNISVVDGDGLAVGGGPYTVTVSAPAKATFTASSDAGAAGLGTGTVTMATNAAGNGTITVIDYFAQTVIISPSSPLPGSSAFPDRDVNVNLTWLPGAADHIAANATALYIAIGSPDVIKMQIVDLYGNSVSSAQSITVTSNGAAVFTGGTLSGLAGLNSNTVIGSTNASGFGTVTLYNDTAQTNTITPHSITLPGSIAAPDRDVTTLVIWTSSVPSPTATATFTATPTRTPTFTASPSFTRTPTITPTYSRTPSVTPTFTSTSTATGTFTCTATPTFSRTMTGTYTITPSPTFTATMTPTFTITASPTFSRTMTGTYTTTPSPTFTVTMTPTFTTTATPTFTWTMTGTYTKTVTPTFTYTVTDTPTYTVTTTPTFTVTMTGTYTTTATPTFTWTMTGTYTKTATPTFTYTVTDTPTYTVTTTPTFTVTMTGTYTKTVTPTFTYTVTNTPTYTVTTTPTFTVTMTDTYTKTATPTFTFTDTPTYTVTTTPTFTVTMTDTYTITATPTFTFTVTDTPTYTVTTTPTFTVTMTDTYTKTATPTFTFTVTDTPTYTVTTTPTFTVTMTDTYTKTATPTFTFTVTDTPTYTVTTTPTFTVTMTDTYTITATPTFTFTVTDTPTYTVTTTPTFTVTMTDTYTITATPTFTFTVTDTPTYTVTTTPTFTVTMTDTYTITATPTFTFTVTDTPTYTVTTTPTYTITATPTFTYTVTDTPTYTVTTTPTFTVTMTDTYTITATPTFTFTVTETPTYTVTTTPTFTVTMTGTYTITATPTFTSTVTDTPTYTVTTTPTFTVTMTDTCTITATPTFTVTITATPTYTITLTTTFTFTITETYTATPTNTAFTLTPTFTLTSTASPTNTASPTFTSTITDTPTYTITASPTFTSSATASVSPSNTNTNTPTSSASPTFTSSATASVSPSNTNTNTPTSSASPTFTSSGTASVSPSNTNTNTPTSSASPTFTLSATASVSPSNTNTNTPTSSASPTFTSSATASVSPSNTNTNTPTSSASPTFTSSATASVSPSNTNTNTPTSSASPTFTSSATASVSPSNTNTNTPTSTYSNTPSATGTDSDTPTITGTETGTNTPAYSPTITPTITLSITGTPPSQTDTPVFTNTPSITLTATGSVSPSGTGTGTPTCSSTSTNTPTITETISYTFTCTPTQTYSRTSTCTGTPSQSASTTTSPTFTPTKTQTGTFTATQSSSATPTGTMTRTITETFTITRTCTVSPTPAGSDMVKITIYDDRGEPVITLGPSQSYIVVHSISFNADPLYANGTNQLVIYDTDGVVINTWDGKDGSGTAVMPGAYTVQVVTKDSGGNEYTVNKPLDVVAENSYDVSVKVYYGPSGITIFGDAVNIQDLFVKIYNINGELIIRRQLQTAANKYSMTWDIRTSGGNKAAHGMYVIVAEFKDSKTGIITRKFGKMAVK